MKIPFPRVSKMDTFRDSEQYTQRPLRESQATEQGGLISERRFEELLDEEEQLEKLNAELKPYENKYIESSITPETNRLKASMSQLTDVGFMVDLYNREDKNIKSSNPFDNFSM